jgi:N-acetyl-gamma-glutamyl-phosphate reductase
MHNNAFSGSIQVAVVGGAGYSGLELCRILRKHPSVTLAATYGTKDINELWAKTSDYNTVFLATPAEVSLELAPKLLKAGVNVIDLSGAFRLNTENIVSDYENFYKFSHTETELVKKAHYGLVPWAKPANTSSSVLVANPGCYATAILMGLLPLLKNNLIMEETLVIDAKSGTTGAGKKAVESQLFSEVEGECLPYKAGVHQHLPEINLFSQMIGGKKIDPFFTTSLLPVRRGIIAGLYAKMLPGKTLQDLDMAFKEFYGNYPFISHGVSLKKVVGTPNTQISYDVVGDKLYLFSSIDNLLKGAASQAVENFNLLNNLPVETGLTQLEAMI